MIASRKTFPFNSIENEVLPSSVKEKIEISSFLNTACAGKKYIPKSATFGQVDNQTKTYKKSHRFYPLLLKEM